jgi:hypothetical protein
MTTPYQRFLAQEIKKQCKKGSSSRAALQKAARKWNSRQLARDHYRPERTRVRTAGIRKKKLLNWRGRTVWLVDGQAVRDRVHIDFVAGGNPGRYGYVPKNEIWVEEHTTPKDILATTVHEIVETRAMEKLGYSYAQAHEKALKIEQRVRNKNRTMSDKDVVRLIKEWLKLSTKRPK